MSFLDFLNSRLFGSENGPIDCFTNVNSCIVYQVFIIKHITEINS